MNARYPGRVDFAVCYCADAPPTLAADAAPRHRPEGGDWPASQASWTLNQCACLHNPVKGLTLIVSGVLAGEVLMLHV